MLPVRNMRQAPTDKSQCNLTLALSSTPKSTAKAASPTRRPTNRITGVLTNVWHQLTVSVSSTSQHVYVLEIETPVGTSYLIRLRYVKRDYRPLLGGIISLSLPSGALKPTIELPSISDAIIASTSARIGVSIYPERDKSHDFTILTPFNAVIRIDIFTALLEKEQREEGKQQMTLQLFAEWINLRRKDVFVGYISAILMKIDLGGLYNRGELFCMPCDCGNIVFGNSRDGVCKACFASQAERGTHVDLTLNPQILASFSDESGGITHSHNLLVADTAWEKLLGRSSELLEAKLTSNGKAKNDAERMLRHWEQRLQYLRLTFVMGWSGEWGGGRIVVLDILD